MKKFNKKHEPLKVQLPGFLVEKEIGLGDVIKRATSAIGIKPCGGCERRSSILNNWFVFTGKNNK
jgi:hypothetical protein